MTAIDAIAAVRAGITSSLCQHGGRRPDGRLWALVHAQSLLCGQKTSAPAIEVIEDDYQRLAARRQDDLGWRT